MDPTPNAALASEVRAEVARQKVKRKDLAERLETTEKTVQRKTEGKTPMSIDQLFGYAAALHVQPSELVARAERVLATAA